VANPETRSPRVLHPVWVSGGRESERGEREVTSPSRERERERERKVGILLADLLWSCTPSGLPTPRGVWVADGVHEGVGNPPRVVANPRGGWQHRLVTPRGVPNTWGLQGSWLNMSCCWRELSSWLVVRPSKSAVHRVKSREWNVSKQKWNLCELK